jgi:hypothetical protein
MNASFSSTAFLQKYFYLYRVLPEISAETYGGPLFLPDFKKILEFVDLLLPNIEFHENPFSCSRIISCVRTGGEILIGAALGCYYVEPALK